VSVRKIKLSWKELEEMLQKAELIFKEEEIKEMTLIKPRGIFIYLTK